MKHKTRGRILPGTGCGKTVANWYSKGKDLDLTPDCYLLELIWRRLAGDLTVGMRWKKKRRAGGSDDVTDHEKKIQMDLLEQMFQWTSGLRRLTYELAKLRFRILLGTKKNSHNISNSRKNHADKTERNTERKNSFRKTKWGEINTGKVMVPTELLVH